MGWFNHERSYWSFLSRVLFQNASSKVTSTIRQHWHNGYPAQEQSPPIHSNISIHQWLRHWICRSLVAAYTIGNQWRVAKSTTNNLLYAFREYNMSFWFDVENTMYGSEYVYHHKFNLIFYVYYQHITHNMYVRIHTIHIQTWAMSCSFLWAPGNDIASQPLGAETSTSVGWKFSTWSRWMVEALPLGTEGKYLLSDVFLKDFSPEPWYLHARMILWGQRWHSPFEGVGSQFAMEPFKIQTNTVLEEHRHLFRWCNPIC